MNPYLSWAILLLAAGGLGYYYKNGSTTKSRAAFLKPSERQNTASPGSKKGRQQRNKPRKNPQQEINSNSSEGSNGAAAPVAAPKAEKEHKVVDAEEPVSTSNGGMDDNYEFAKQFSKAMSGTPLAAKSKTGTSTRTKKQPKQQQEQLQPLPNANGDMHANHVSTATSSTAGADADDDMSPINSPRIKPAGDVSDMLEEPAPAASVLRLTGDVEGAQSGKKKKQSAFKSVETKKQRQARRKREEKNEMVKEAEKARRAMVENQMHTAREYERQQAKSAASSPPTNAWATSPSTLAHTTDGGSNGASNTKPSAMPLLDTFEPSQPTSKQTGEKKPWTKDLPSEEEQMRMLNTLSSENEWTTVSNRKKEKRGKGNAESMSEASSSEVHGNPVEASW
ncbi:hypothetical protein MferCBS31731_005910 [Microsporum ferrugineum]